MDSRFNWPLVDIHAHIYPDVDDGPRDVTGTQALFELAQHVGFRTMTATPHLKTHLSPAYVDRVDRGRELTEPLADAESIMLCRGFEVLIQPSLIHWIDDGEQLTLNGSRYLLVELPFDHWPLYAESVLFEIETRGLIPVLAHPERYLEAIDDPAKVLTLAERGVLMQVTYASLTGVLGKGPLALSKLLIERNVVDLIATDAHSDGRRLGRVPEAIEILTQWVGYERAYQMAVTNPEAVVSDRDLPASVQIEAAEIELTSNRRWKFW